MVSTAAASSAESAAIAGSVAAKVQPKGNKRHPVRVAVRIRPALAGQEEVAWATVPSKKEGQQCLKMESIVNSKKKEKSYEGFGAVLPPSCDNVGTFAETVEPMLARVLDGKVAAAFAFGHTGSGKTHTMFGYGDERGVFDQAATLLCARLDETRGRGPSEELLLELRFSEILNGKVRDLVGGCECAVREDASGNIHIRGPTVVEENGCVRVTPPARVHASSVEGVRAAVAAALQLRRTGSSNVHSQSSRSHAVLEMEVITRAVADARDLLVTAESELVPVGWKRTDHMIKRWEARQKSYSDREGRATAERLGLPEDAAEVKAELLKGFHAWAAANHQEPDPEQPALDAAVAECEAKIQQCQDAVQSAIAQGGPSCGGTLVLVDLAGSEYAMDDSSSRAVKRDKAAIAEGKEINKSLLCLKECFRALHSSNGHVNFRGSKLTMLLRRHLVSDGASACMIANVSPGEEDARKTANTLAYSALVAQAGA